MARMIVSAEIQSITYNHFLPAILGENTLRSYRGYQSEVNPGIANIFSTAAYRFGHSMLSPELKRVNADGAQSEEGHIALASAFFNPTEIANNGIDSILRGLASQVAQEIDNEVIDAVRNFLFGPPGSGGFDLASLNIQRGRDHGLASFNDVRESYGLKALSSFSDISDDPQVQANLADVYDSVDAIDAWVGGLAEDHASGAMMGVTWQAVIKDQFERLRDGDRFYYRNALPESLVEMVEQQTLATIIRRNTDIDDEIQDDVFRADLSDQPFEVVNIERGDRSNEFMIEFRSRPGRRYQIETSSAMRHCNVAEREIESHGTRTTATVTIDPGASGMCFRVREL
ncbi:MAG: peroxidase [Verrucomicrobiales bacterium]|jgi:peroxidase